MVKFRRLATLFLFLLCADASFSALAAQTSIRGLRLWTAPDNTRLVFDVSGSVQHTLFSLNNPERLVIDIRDTRIQTRLPQPKSNDRVLKRIRSAPRNVKDVRVVLDLKRKVRPKSFVLKPNNKYGNRLVVDLYDAQSKTAAPVRKRQSLEHTTTKLRNIIVAIDAGHGGEDPGASGFHGTYEKHVVMAIASKLETLMKQQRGMQPLMIRTGDYFISLRDRIKKARLHKADLLVSIHADAFRDPGVQGASVYVLSKHGASSEAARWLAESENASDKIGGVKLDDKDDMLVSLLLDLSQSYAIETGLQAADEILKGLRQLGKMHKRTVQQAGFVVLKAPDIPSVLIETAFISNPDEERRLKSNNHQWRLAKAIMSGLRSHFSAHPPLGTRFAASKHVVIEGDTLSGIAYKYKVKQSTLRTINRLKHDGLAIGQTLRIPFEAGN